MDEQPEHRVRFARRLRAVLAAVPVVLLAACQPDGSVEAAPPSFVAEPPAVPAVTIPVLPVYGGGAPAAPAAVPAAASTAPAGSRASTSAGPTPSASTTATVAPCPNGLGDAYGVPLIVTAARRSAVVSWWDPMPVSGITAFLLAAVPEEGSIKNAPQPPLRWQRIAVNGCRQETVTIPNLVSGRSYEFWLQAQSVDQEPVPGTTGTLITRMVGRSSATKIK